MDRRDERLVSAFAKVLQRRRRALDLSQEELAHRAGLSTSYVSLLETRKRQPTLTVLSGLAGVLEISLSDMIRELEAEL